MSIDFFISNNLLSYSCSLVYTGYIAIKQWYIFHTNTISPTIVPTYSRVLSVIEKALWDLVEEYQGIKKSLQDLVEDQKRNTAS